MSMDNCQCAPSWTWTKDPVSINCCWPAWQGHLQIKIIIPIPPSAASVVRGPWRGSLVAVMKAVSGLLEPVFSTTTSHPTIRQVDIVHHALFMPNQDASLSKALRTHSEKTCSMTGTSLRRPVPSLKTCTRIALFLEDLEQRVHTSGSFN